MGITLAVLRARYKSCSNISNNHMQKRLTPELQGPVALHHINGAVLLNRPRNVPSEGFTGYASVRERSVSFHACGVVKNCTQNHAKYWRYIVRSPDELRGLVRPSNSYHSWEQNPDAFTSESFSVFTNETCKAPASGKEMVWQWKVLMRLKLFLNC